MKTAAENHFKDKIESWISVDDQNSSPLREGLLSIRDRLFIDSMYVKMLRAKAGDHRETDKFEKDELDEVLRLASRKETPS